MRQTFTKLIQQAQDYCLQDTSATTLAFIKRELNNAFRFIRPKIQEFTTNRTQTTTTVIAQQYYHLPVDSANVNTVTININGVLYPLNSVESQDIWDKYNAVQFNSISIPKYFLERKRDIGIWPIPTTASTMTITYNYREKDMSVDDFTTGQVTYTNGSQTITHTTSLFTAAMIGRWFQGGDGFWYKIIDYVSSNTLTIETAYAGATGTGSYTIGESPDIPEDGHELLAYRTAFMYFMGPRYDATQATYWDNMFYTGDPQNGSRDSDKIQGGLIDFIDRYSKRSESRIITVNEGITFEPDDLIWGERLH